MSQNITTDKHKEKKQLYKQYRNKMSFLAFDLILASVKRILV